MNISVLPQVIFCSHNNLRLIRQAFQAVNEYKKEHIKRGQSYAQAGQMLAQTFMAVGFCVLRSYGFELLRNEQIKRED